MTHANHTQKTALMFPGQGSQRPAMAKDLFRQFPHKLIPLWQEAQEVFQCPLKDIVTQEEDPEVLRIWAQPALFLLSMALFKILQEEMGVRSGHFSLMAGHSLGEYSALCAAGVISFSQGLYLIKQRKACMAQASPGGMLAVMGMKREALQDFLTSFSQGSLYVSNHNAPEQSVLSGTLQAIESAKVKLGEKTGVRTVVLPVSGPFHCPLMCSAQEAFCQHLQACHEKEPFRDAACPIVGNGDAVARSNGTQIFEILKNHMTNPVLWVASQKTFEIMGVHQAVELGAGTVLCALTKKNAPSIKTYCAGDTQGLLDLKNLMRM